MMRALKNSGISWIGAIPEGWGTTRLKKVATPQKGKAIDFPIEGNEGDVAYLNGGVFPSFYVNRHNTKGSTIAISEGGASAGHVQFMESPFWCGGHCYAVTPHRGQNNKFLFWSIKAAESVLKESKTGTAMPNLKQNEVLNLSLPTPSSEEQVRISNFLDKKNLELDQEVSLLRKKISLLQEYRKSMIQKLVTSGSENSPPMKPALSSWFSTIPSSWQSKRIKSVTKPTVPTPPPDEYVGLEHISSWTGAYETKSRKSLEVKTFFACREGTILVSKLRPYLAKAFLAKTDLSCTTELIPLSFKPEILPEYAAYLMICPGVIQSLEDKAGGTKMPRISIETLQDLVIPVPPISEQENICGCISSLTNKIDRSIEATKSKISLLIEYRQALIFEAVTGKLDIPSVP